MLVSHRRHAPVHGVSIACDRVLHPSWIARRVKLAGVVQDEHLTRALGKGTADRRARLMIVLAGRLEATIDDRSFDLGPGDVVAVPCIADVVTCGGDDEIVEIDWDDGAPVASRSIARVEHGTIRGRALEAARAIGRGLSEDTLPSVFADAARVLAAEGLPLDGRGAHDAMACARVDADDQRLFDAIDDTLEHLDAGPAVVELEGRLGWSRRTVSRRTRDVHARYGIHGIDGESWRAVRDFYRVLIGSIFASHPEVTTTRLASVLGYASPDALCHAFANAGLPSPGAVKKMRPAA